MKKLHVLHVISGLERGGAERNLQSLVRRLHATGHRNTVVTMTSQGPIGTDLLEANIDVRALGMRRGWPSPVGIRKLKNLFREIQPNIVQSWLYHADLLCALAFGRQDKVPLIWNVRGTIRPWRSQGIRTSLVVRANVRLSGRPSVIIFNSNRGMQDHLAIGYKPGRAEIIANGIDTDLFQPNRPNRRALREQLKIGRSEFVVGHVARFQRMKNQKNVLKAFGKFAVEFPQAKLVMVGRGINDLNQELTSWVERYATSDKVYLLDDRKDIDKVYQIMDAFVLASKFGEGFPNSLAEAMASGVLSMTADVGDSIEILGDHGVRLSSTSMQGLLDGFERAVSYTPEQRAETSQRARQSIIGRYSIERMVGEYERLYRSSLQSIFGGGE